MAKHTARPTSARRAAPPSAPRPKKTKAGAAPTPAAADVPPQATRDRVASLYGHAAQTAVTAPEPLDTLAGSPADENSSSKDLAPAPIHDVDLGSDLHNTESVVPEPPPPEPRTTIMPQATVTLNLKGLSKSGAYALYSGMRTVSRLAITNFPDSKPPQTLTVSGDLAGPREKLTAEERKARAKSRPKPTLAERIAKEEKRLAKLKEKAAQAEAVPA